MKQALIVALLLLPSCAMQIGPGEHGWVMWDVCGFEGGAEAELEVMGNGLRVGCSDKPAAVADEVPVRVLHGTAAQRLAFRDLRHATFQQPDALQHPACAAMRPGG